MAPDPSFDARTSLGAGEYGRIAGVLLLLAPRRGQLFFPLTKRTETVFRHRGQISLPGGEQDAGETPVRTALRETEEELGVELADVEIHGVLTPLYIPPSDFCVHPVVASFPGALKFRPRAEEVAEVIEVPLARLLDPSARLRETRFLAGRPVEIPFFDFGGHKVWGATAMILAEFAALFEP